MMKILNYLMMLYQNIYEDILLEDLWMEMDMFLGESYNLFLRHIRFYYKSSQDRKPPVKCILQSL
mgnify:CR=1 FL=1